jgi:hypothetical protein
MKAKILSLFSLLTLLLVSTAILADGRPTGIRIGRVANISASGVEIDITVPGTDSAYTGGLWNGNTSVWLGNTLGNTLNFLSYGIFQFESSSRNVPLPWAIDWGDGSYYAGSAPVFGPPGGPFVGTFAHTYVPGGMPYSYTITVGDALCCSPIIGVPKGAGITTGNVITGSTRYLLTFGSFYDYAQTFNSLRYARLAVTNTASVTTGQGIPVLNIYGLLAMSLVLVGAGILVYRKPQRTVA